MNEHLTATQAIIDALTARAETAEAAVTTLRQNCNARTVEALMSSRHTLQGELATATRERSVAYAELHAVRKQRDELLDQRGVNIQRIDDLEDELEAVRKQQAACEIARLTQELKKTTKERDAIGAELHERMSNWNVMEAERERVSWVITEDRTALAKELKEVTGQRNNYRNMLESERATAEVRGNDLRHKLGEECRATGLLRSELDAARKEMGELLRVNRELREHCDAANTKLREERDELEAARSERDELRGILESRLAEIARIAYGAHLPEAGTPKARALPTGERE